MEDIDAITKEMVNRAWDAFAEEANDYHFPGDDAAGKAILVALEYLLEFQVVDQKFLKSLHESCQRQYQYLRL
jgi:hypothetical protein